jgi:hypothetical protein
VQMAAGALLVLPFAAAFETAPTIAATPTLHELTAFAALAGLGSVVPFVLYAYGQKRVSPEVAGSFVNLEPLVGAMIGALAFGDPFGPTQLLGATAIVGGILMSVEWRPVRTGKPQGVLDVLFQRTDLPLSAPALHRPVREHRLHQLLDRVRVDARARVAPREP